MYNQIKLLNRALNSINKDKGHYDFSSQIKNNFLCMVMAVIRNEFNSGLSSKNIVNKIQNTCKDKDIIDVLYNNNLNKLTIFDKLIIKGIKYNNKVYFYFLLKIYMIKYKDC